MNQTLERIKGVPLAASNDHPCLGCGGRVRLARQEPEGFYRWMCGDCGYQPTQWWPLGRRFPLIGRPEKVSSLDRPNPRFLGHSDGRSDDGTSQMASEYRQDVEWVERERTRFDRKRIHFT